MVVPLDAPGYYLQSSYEHIVGHMPGQEECDICMEEETSGCSRCKTVKYCGTECQTKGWKQGHKLRCFDTVF